MLKIVSGLDINQIFLPLATLANAGVNLYNGIASRKLQRELHEDNHKFQRELEALAFNRQKSLAELHFAFQHEESENAHVRQLQLQEYERMLDSWPLEPTPMQLTSMDESLSAVPALTVLLAPLWSPSRTANSTATLEDLNVHRAAEKHLRDFCRKNYPTSGERPIHFVDQAWKPQAIHGGAAIAALFHFRRGLPTLVLQPELMEGDEELVDLAFAYWGLAHPEDPVIGPIQGALQIPRFRQSFEGPHSLILTRCYQFLTAVFTDCHFLLSSAGRTRPILPKLFSEWQRDAPRPTAAVNPDALKCAVSAYSMILNKLAARENDDARRLATSILALELAENLLRLQLPDAAGQMLRGAIDICSPSQVTNILDPIARLHEVRLPLSISTRFLKAFAEKSAMEASGFAPTSSEVDIDGSEDCNLIINSRTLLSQLRQSLRRLEHRTSAMLGDSILQDSLHNANRLLDVADMNLRRPVLKLATIAVTSAGKSTLINAFIGREIAPVAKDEMSAGTLTIRHKLFHGLEFKQTVGAKWPVGRVTDQDNGALNDAIIYQRLRSLMKAYWDACREANPEMPRVVVEAPVLYGNDPSLLLLPTTVDLEIIDLPGLNSMNGDDRNLKHVIDCAKEAFCVFVFDYRDTTDRPDIMLRRIKERVFSIKPDAADVLFVLNKYLDRDRSDSDKSLTAELQEKQLLIQTELNLAAPPAIVALEARLWHNAQLAWGASSLEADPQTDNEQRPIYLAEISEHYSGKIAKFVRERPDDSELQRWWKVNRDLEDLSIADLRYFLHKIAYPLSGADEFLLTLKTRIRDRLGALLLRPIFRQSIGEAQKVLAQVSATGLIRRQDSLAAVEEVAKDLHNKLQMIQTKLDTSTTEIAVAVDAIQNFLLSDGEEHNVTKQRHVEFHQAIQNLTLGGVQTATNKLYTLINDLKNDNRERLLEAMLNPLAKFNNQSNQLSVVLQENGMSLTKARALASSYCAYISYVRPFQGNDDIRYLDEKRSTNESPLATEARYLLERLRNDMIDALSEVVRFHLREKAGEVESSIKDLLKALQSSAEANAADQGLETSLFIAVLQPWFSEEFTKDIEIPETCFRITTLKTTQGNISKYEKVGTKIEYYRPWYKLWLVEESREVDRFDDVEYNRVSVPGGEGIRKACLNWHALHMREFGLEFGKWIRQTLNNWHTKVGDAAKKFVELTNAEVSAYKDFSQEQLFKRGEEWRQVEEEAESAKAIVEAIEGLC